MQRVSRDDRIYVLAPHNKPVASIDSGEELIVETWDAFEGVRDPAKLEEVALRGPATGPIYVIGAEPGDALKVEFISITAVGDAVHMVRPGRGFLDTQFNQAHSTRMSIVDGQVVLPSGVRLPLQPSMGLVATNPHVPAEHGQ